MPFASNAFSRAESVFGATPVSPDWRSRNRCGLLRAKSRTINNVHRSPTRSRARAIEQFCRYAFGIFRQLAQFAKSSRCCARAARQRGWASLSFWIPSMYSRSIPEPTWSPLPYLLWPLYPVPNPKYPARFWHQCFRNSSPTGPIAGGYLARGRRPLILVSSTSLDQNGRRASLCSSSNRIVRT